MIETIRVTGGPAQRGHELGRRLRERVRETWRFYRDEVFLDPGFDLASSGSSYFAAIRGFSAEYATKLEAMAEAAGLQAWEVAALNARTEIMHQTIYRTGSARIGECTALYFSRSRLLAQNWDWLDRLESLMVLVEIEREDGHRILQLTEPGMLGKIGFNSRGIGTCLNNLSGRACPPAVPVHVLLRAVLDADSIDAARRIILDAQLGTCAHILVGDDRGQGLGIELFGDEAVFMESDGGSLLHTNHYVVKDRDQAGDPALPSSHARLMRAQSLARGLQSSTIADAQSILLDQEGGENAICAAYEPLGPFRIGTVASIVMDLVHRQLWVTPGNPRDNEYQHLAM